MSIQNLVVSVVIPAYNEAKTIEEIIFRTHKAMEIMQVPYEIIVVDDGSTDNTRLLAERYKATVVGNGRNRGKGHTLKIGFGKANGDIVVTIDADGSHQPEEIPKLLKPLLLNSADIVTGSRFLGARENGSVKRLHILGNHLFNLLIFVLMKKRITDSQTGFRALRKRVIREICLVSDGYQIETELTVKTLKNGYHVQEEPITCGKRKKGSSKLKIVSDGRKILETILRTYFSAS